MTKRRNRSKFHDMIGLSREVRYTVFYARHHTYFININTLNLVGRYKYVQTVRIMQTSINSDLCIPASGFLLFFFVF